MGIHPETIRKAAVGLRWADEEGLIADEPPLFDEIKPKKSIEKKREEAKQQETDMMLSVIQMRDERRALNANIRYLARAARDRAYMMDRLNEIGQARYRPSQRMLKPQNEAQVLAATFADPHFGAHIRGYHGEQYDTNVAAQRMKAYVENIIEYAQQHMLKDIHLIVLGDLISGMIHKTVQVTNRENVIDQVMTAGELMADFIFELSQEFNSVTVTTVPGNHSRIDRKEDALNGDRLDKVVMWYAKGTLGHVDNIQWNDSGDTMTEFTMAGRKYVAVHGDYDAFSDAGCGRLINYLGYRPDGIFSAHMHKSAITSCGDVAMIQSGSFVGSGDEHTERGRLRGGASQILCIASAYGIEEVKIVKLS